MFGIGKLFSFGLGAVFGGGVGGLFAPMIANFIMNMDITKQVLSGIEDTLRKHTGGLMDVLSTVGKLAQLATSLTQIATQLSSLLNSNIGQQLRESFPDLFDQMKRLVTDIQSTAQKITEVSNKISGAQGQDGTASDQISSTDVESIYNQVSNVTSQIRKLESNLPKQQVAA